MADPQTSDSVASGGDDQRRGFLVRAFAITIGTIVGIFPLLAGLVVFLNPLRGRKGAKGVRVRVATVDAIPDDGVPRRFPVRADRVDAWNRFPNEPIGAVYLRRDKGEQTVHAFNATCPHLGCGVAVVRRQGEPIFRCPCHNSSFQLDGDKIEDPGRINPSPRGLDPLVVDEKALADTGEIWVEFLNFKSGRPDREPKS